MGGGETIKREGRRLSLFRTVDEEVSALDKRRPHEGEPLAAGSLKAGG